MSFSQSAAMNVVPLLSRIVLAMAFIPAGWNKLSTTTTFRGEDAAILRSLGVTGTDGEPAGVPAAATGEGASGASTDSWSKTLTGGMTGGGWSLLAAPPPPSGSPEASPTAKPATAGTDAASRPSAAGLPDSGALAPGTGDMRPLTTRSLHAITLMVQRHGWAYPVYNAYAATAAELLGGALILVGLFARLWGLALAGTMAVAFWFTTAPMFAANGSPMVLFDIATHPFADFNRMHVQGALFVLAFGVFLVGAGAVSLDRMIFRRVPVVHEEA